MTSSAEDQSSIRLRKLVARGFRLMPPVRDADGELMALIYVRPHGDIVDVVELRGEDDVRAARVSQEQGLTANPATAEWHTAGAACEVLDQVLALPERLIVARA
ncbi:hypothetical protein ABT337_31760 [Saccharopolyspora hirsuta]|uniref:Uncharacterized protein n=1 Tax=Saccharopolyspora hirsuta TaxID=1837 RepID=A0A5M7BAX1_SACHI|nr:hypothetical protein [Saccharopolyspora hirsuta]KAA5824674.1 hypothetical protein F1721_34110 [Saccharopolyspora hirsuta]